MRTVSFNVKGMHCESCEILISEDLEEIEGLTVKNISSSSGVVTVVYDETKNSEEDLKKVISSAGDFTVE